MCVHVGTQYALKIKSKWDHAKHTVLQLKLLDLSQKYSHISGWSFPVFFSMVGKDSMFYGCTTIQSVSIKEHLNCFHILAQCCSVNPCTYNCSVSVSFRVFIRKLLVHQVCAHFQCVLPNSLPKSSTSLYFISSV